MARLPGLEPGTSGFVVRRPIQLGYRRIRSKRNWCDEKGSNFRARIFSPELYRLSYRRNPTWCQETDLNRRRADLQSAALPTELSRH